MRRGHKYINRGILRYFRSGKEWAVAGKLSHFVCEF